MHWKKTLNRTFIQPEKSLKASIYISIALLLSVSLCQAQVLEPDSLKKQKVYHSIEEGEDNPLAVYRLDLSKHKLTSLPDGIFQFPNLQELILDKNKLTSLPAELAQFPYLQILKASQNEIEIIPTAVIELKHLRVLDLGDNLISKIPDDIDHLGTLESLILWDNPVEYYPVSLGDLPALKYLDLLHNQISYDTLDRLKAALPDTRIITSEPCTCQDGE